MYEHLGIISLIIILAPLFASAVAGLFGKWIGRRGAHTVTIACIALSFVLSLLVCKLIVFDGMPNFNYTFYTWAISGEFKFHIGFLIDALTSLMIVTVTFVSLLVHIYSMGYMHDDPGYQRFFSYISLFTFAMLTLTMSNNFLQLYFGWEGVGLASYLLIGFWFKRESANQGSLKAFLVNRVGDFGFLLGIAICFNYFGTVNYLPVFAAAPTHVNDMIQILPGVSVSMITAMCILLFIGAMGKSAQVPLHVWLPESMEGPTPISALIHAATMVTAGIFMVCRMSPLFEYSPTALSVVMIIGATGALFTGILALVQNDIKRVIAYSTLSQLGYMVAALGASAYAASLFHLMTHACFKALLFLAAGSVIVAMHHEQDMRKMGGLRKYMPITYITFLIGSLSMCAIPPFAGFYSKDAIIDVLGRATTFGSSYAYLCVLIGTFVTALYSFRAIFMTFHNGEHWEGHHTVKEEYPSILIPLIVLAIPSIFIGMFLVNPLLFGAQNWLHQSIKVLPMHNVLAHLAATYEGQLALIGEAFLALPLWLALAGIACAWLAYIKYPGLPAQLAQRFSLIYRILIRKYGFDEFNEWFFVRGGRALAGWLFHFADLKVIDDLFVLGSGRVVTWASRLARRIQSGYLFHYALMMVLGLFILLVGLILRT